MKVLPTFFLFVVVVAAYLVVISTVVSSAEPVTGKRTVRKLRKDKNGKETEVEEVTSYTAPENVRASVPEYTKPANKKIIKCNACKAIAEEMHRGLTALAQRNNNRPRRDQQSTFLEKLSGVMKTDYGLLMKNNVATFEFSRDEDISRIKGNWVNVLLEEQCGSLVVDYEDEILARYEKDKNDFPAFQEYVCRKLVKTCEKKNESFGFSDYAKKMDAKKNRGDL